MRPPPAGLGTSMLRLGLELVIALLGTVRRALEPGLPQLPALPPGPAPYWPRYPDSPSAPRNLGSIPTQPEERFPMTSYSSSHGTSSSRLDLAPQSLSGKGIKVVQYCIVSVVPNLADNARVLVGPKVVAFGDEMTSEDFTAWIIAENTPPEPPPKDSCFPPEKIARCWERKYLRVAFTVMGRFAKADIDWKELQALSVARIAEHFDPQPCGESSHSEQQKAAAAAAVAAAAEMES